MIKRYDVKMIVKEDLEEAKERMKAWWNHEKTDRPVISYNIFEGVGSDKALMGSLGLKFELAQDWDGIDSLLNVYEQYNGGLVYGAECIPSYFINYGPGIMAAVLGVTPEYKSGTVWFHRQTDLKDIVSVLESAKLNDNNEWYVRLKRTTEIAAKRGAKGNYAVSMTDLGGILDILVSFIGPQNVIIQMKRNPELIDTCRAIIMEKYLKVFDELQNIINNNGVDGCGSWLNVWCPKRYYTMQCDLSVMLNPKFFERFVLPDLKEQSESLDYALYHLDGPEQIKFLDDILPLVDGIQYVPGTKPGVPKDGEDKWLPLYKKIQNAGKNNILMLLDQRDVAPFYKKIDPKGFFVYCVFLNRDQAECYLPEFVGGNGGQTVNDAITWVKGNNIIKINKAKMRQFLDENNLILNKKYESFLFKEVKRNISGKEIVIRAEDFLRESK